MICLTCRKSISRGEGMLFITRELVSSPAFWAAIFRHSVRYHQERYDELRKWPQHQNAERTYPDFDYTLRMICKERLGTMLCDDCADAMLPQTDKRLAKRRAAAWWTAAGRGGYIPPDASGVDPAIARDAAANGWQVVMGRPPSNVETKPSPSVSLAAKLVSRVFRTFGLRKKAYVIAANKMRPSLRGTDAIRNGDARAVRQLIVQGADPNERAWDGETPLLDAVYFGNLEIVKILVEHGATINDNSIYGTPLHCAAKRGHKEVVEYLIGQGADVNIDAARLSSSAGGGTPLHWAAMMDRTDIVKLLLVHGAKQTVRASDGCKPSDLTSDKAIKALLDAAKEGHEAT